MDDKLLAWQSTLGYEFSDIALLETAFTHSSYSNENRREQEDNERLEFLGDAILGAVISTLLYRAYPSEREGVLSSYRQTIVCEASLASIACELHIGDMLRLGNGELQNDGRNKRSILADAVEAVGMVGLDLELDGNGRPRRECGSRDQDGNNALLSHGGIIP